MEQNEMLLEFTKEDKEQGLNVVDLGALGKFIAEYLVVKTNVVYAYGYWYPTEEALKLWKVNNSSLDMDDAPFWSGLEYIPYSMSEVNAILSKSGTTATDIFRLTWRGYTIVPLFTMRKANIADPPRTKYLRHNLTPEEIRAE